MTTLETFRNRLAWRLANWALNIGTPRYRKFVTGAVEYGLRSAARDERYGIGAPIDWRASGVDLTVPSVRRTVHINLDDCAEEGDW